MIKINRLFVYGTLKKGFKNHALLRDSEFLGQSNIRGAELYLDITNHPDFESLREKVGTEFDPFPYAYEGIGNIKGEVYDISNNENLIPELDIFEGVDKGPYTRDVIVTEYGLAYIYLVMGRPSENAKKIEEFLTSHQGRYFEIIPR